MIYATLEYGAVGGAGSWAFLNLTYTIFGVMIMHRYVLKGELKRWYMDDTLKPILITGLVLFLGRSMIDLTNSSTFFMLAAIGVQFFVAAGITAFVLPKMRESV